MAGSYGKIEQKGNQVMIEFDTPRDAALAKRLVEFIINNKIQ